VLSNAEASEQRSAATRPMPVAWRPCCKIYPFGQCYFITAQAIAAWAIGEVTSHMASTVKVEQDNKFAVVKLDPVYANELKKAESAADKFATNKEKFQHILKQTGASGSVPMNDKDYKKLSEAKDLKTLVNKLVDLENEAQTCLLSIEFAPQEIGKAAETDADNVAKESAKILTGQIEEKEQEVAKLQKEIAALQKDLTAISKTIATVLKAKAAPLVDEADKIKDAFPKFVSGGHPFGFERWQKYLKAKLK
jgi:chromosome segregation ATPase